MSLIIKETRRRLWEVFTPPRRRIASNSGIAGRSNDQGRGAARCSGAWSACLDAVRVCVRGLIEPVVKADFCFATGFVAIAAAIPPAPLAKQLSQLPFAGLWRSDRLRLFSEF